MLEDRLTRAVVVYRWLEVVLEKEHHKPSRSMFQSLTKTPHANPLKRMSYQVTTIKEPRLTEDTSALFFSLE